MALEEFMNHGPVTGDESYHGIAGIHGSIADYNGYEPGRDGYVLVRIWAVNTLCNCN